MKRFGLLILITALLLGGCGSANDKVGQAEQGEKTAPAQEVYIMAGKIEAGEEINLVSKIPAKVTKIKVDVGSRVKKGEPLVYLDVQDIKAQVKQAEAGVKVAQANLTRTRKGARPEQLAQARAALDSAKTNYENAKNNLQRMEQLFQEGGISAQQLEAAQGQYASAEAQFKSAQEQVNMLAQGETPETIQVLESQVKQAQAAVELARTQLNNAVITSPVDGVVSMRNIDEGEMAISGQPLITVVNSEKVSINANLPTRLLSQIKAGQEVVARVLELPGQKFEGKIEVISPVVDSRSKNILVKVALKNPAGLLKPGMVAEIGLKK